MENMDNIVIFDNLLYMSFSITVILAEHSGFFTSLKGQLFHFLSGSMYDEC